MANAIYPLYKKAILSGGANTDLLTGTVKAVLIDAADYTYSAAHQFLTDIAAGARVGTPATLSNKTISDAAVFDSDAVTLTSVTGDQSEAVLLFIDTGVEATSRLVAYLDTGHTGLPITPNGGNITIQTGASHWFQL